MLSNKLLKPPKYLQKNSRRHVSYTYALIKEICQLLIPQRISFINFGVYSYHGLTIQSCKTIQNYRIKAITEDSIRLQDCVIFFFFIQSASAK